jgi:hypothetical protein
LKSNGGIEIRNKTKRKGMEEEKIREEGLTSP